jgi:mRNA-degrading endonuclease toxin of MazEF toxin-antitoxin module
MSKKELIDSIVHLLQTEFEPPYSVVSARDRSFLEQSTVAYLETRLSEFQQPSAPGRRPKPVSPEVQQIQAERTWDRFFFNHPEITDHAANRELIFNYALSLSDDDGIHHCVVISNDDFNVNERGVVVIPVTSATDGEDREKVVKVGGPWVCVISQGKPAYVLCEQIRYIDRRRHVSGVDVRLAEFDLMQIQKKLDSLLKPPFNAVNAAA